MTTCDGHNIAPQPTAPQWRPGAVRCAAGHPPVTCPVRLVAWPAPEAQRDSDGRPIWKRADVARCPACGTIYQPPRPVDR